MPAGSAGESKRFEAAEVLDGATDFSWLSSEMVAQRVKQGVRGVDGGQLPPAVPPKVRAWCHDEAHGDTVLPMPDKDAGRAMSSEIGSREWKTSWGQPVING